MSDATCYESHIRFPTNQKLLFESVDWIYKEIRSLSKLLQRPVARTKYLSVIDAYLSYAKTRKKIYKKGRKISRCLLHLLSKLIHELDTLLGQKKFTHSKLFYKRYNVIKKILEQQTLLFDNYEVKNRIVSIDKPYIRPIVRGKETKSVEFGAKVNTIQVGGFNFIERIDFNAFHEGIRVPECIDLSKILFHIKPHFFAGDKLYANNKNRTYCKENHIITNFIPKGRASSDEREKKVIRRELNIVRSTILEGSFGTEKEYYGLRKIRARTKNSEVLWILFGIHTANFSRLARKLMKQKEDTKKLA